MPTYNIAYYCRASKIDRNGVAPVEASICINGDRKFINLPFKCDPAEFNRKRRPKYIQDYLDTQRVRMATAVTEMATEGIPLTASSFKDYIKTGGVKSYRIEDLFNDYFRLLKKKVGVSITQTVYDKYERVRELFSDFVDFNRECASITPALIEEFYAELQSKYQDSTSCGMMTKLKSVIRYGIDNGKIRVNPFQHIKVKKGVKEVETITLSQLNTIRQHKFVPRVQKVADLFIFACGSGLAYCDCINLKPEDFVERDGKICVFKERQKTGVKFYSVLLPWAEEIVKKYNYDFSSLSISNQKVNQYLKEIEDCCEIDKTLTFHKGRHFYALYTLNNGIPVTTVQKMLGHKNINQTMHYTRALETTVLEDFKKSFE